MSSYLTDPKQAFVPTNLYTPNFDAIGGMLKIRQNEYDRGFSQVKSTYNSILNAPLTKEANIIDRDKYIKKAQDDLKNLSSVDLSFTQNVAQASKVFEPFYQDDDIIQDMIFTKSQQAQLDKGFADQNKKDSERDKYEYFDPRAIQYMTSGMTNVKKAAKGDKSVYQVRNYAPFVDQKKYAIDMAKEAGFKVEFTKDNGPVLMKTENGPASVPNWTTFLQGITDERFNYQFNVMGTLAKEQGIAKLKERDPSLTDQQAIEIMSKDTLASVYQGYQDMHDKTKESLEKAQKEFDELGKKVSASDAEEKAILDRRASLNSVIKQYNNRIQDLASEMSNYKPGSDEYNKKLQSFNNSPEQEFFKIFRHTSISNLANALAANEKQSQTLNPVYHDAWQQQAEFYKLKQGDRRLDIAQQNADNKDLGLELKYNLDGEALDADGQPMTSYNGIRGTGNGGRVTKADVEKARINQGTFVGTDATDISKMDIGTAYKNYQKNNWELANSIVLDPTKLASVLKDIPGIIFDDTVTYVTMLKNSLNVMGGKIEGSQNKEDFAVYNKVNKALANELGIKEELGPVRARNAILELVHKNLLDKTKNPERLEPKDYEMIKDHYMQATEAIMTYDKNEKMKEELSKKTLSSSKYKSIANDTGTDIVSDKEISTRLKPISLVSAVTGKETILTAEKLGSLYKEGKIGKADRLGIQIDLGDGMKHHTFSQSMNAIIPEDRKGLTPAGFYVNQMLANVEQRYGSSKKLNETIKKFNNEIIPNTSYFVNKTGQRGAIINYDFSKEADPDNTATKLAMGILSADNRSAYYLGDEKIPQSEELDTFMKKIEGMGSGELNKIMSAVRYKTQGKEGKPTLVLRFKQDYLANKKDDSPLHGMSPDLQKKLETEGLEIEISSNTKNPALQSLPNSTGQYFFDKVLRGEAIKSDPMLEPLGFKYTIQPDNKTNPTGAYLYLERKELDPKTGKMDDPKDASGRYLPKPQPVFVSFANRNPDEIVAYMNSMLDSHMKRFFNNQSIYKSSTIANRKTAAQLEAERGISYK